MNSMSRCVRVNPEFTKLRRKLLSPLMLDIKTELVCVLGKLLIGTTTSYHLERGSELTVIVAVKFDVAIDQREPEL